MSINAVLKKRKTKKKNNNFVFGFLSSVCVFVSPVLREKKDLLQCCHCIPAALTAGMKRGLISYIDGVFFPLCVLLCINRNKHWIVFNYRPLRASFGLLRKSFIWIINI